MAFNLSSGQDESEMADINVTPLVDVMLVLLIIFMITAPLLHQGIEVTLPQTEAAETLKLRVDDPLVLSIKPDGLVYVRNQPIHPTQLVERLQPMLESRDDDQVFLKGDRDISYAQFINVVDLLYKGGVRHVGLVTEQIAGK
ncbi:MAG TPA: biopolymer transporter ExbD [Thermoanaerobaculia bacterium]|jgi:biopolymer transport protein TolR